MKLPLLFLSIVFVLGAQTRIDYNSQIRNRPIAAGATLPGSCTVDGNFFTLTTTSQLYVCQGGVYVFASARFGGQLSLKDFGAKGDGSADDTTAIQAAMNAATGGRMLYCPKGVYKISAPLIVPAYLYFYGPPTDYQNGQSLSGGCMIKWAGAAPGTPYVAGAAMLDLNSVYGTRLDGINLDGSNTTNLTGYMLRSGTGSSQRNRYNNMTLMHFGNAASNLTGAGMTLGTDAFPAEQVDGGDFGPFYIVDSYEGVRLHSQNVSYTIFHGCTLSQVNTAFHIAYSGLAMIQQCVGGTMQGANPHFVWITGPHGLLEVTDVQAENDLGTGAAAQMLQVDGPSDVSPIIWKDSVFDFAAQINQNANFISIGNRYDASITLGSSVTAESIGDAFTSPATVVKSGTNATWRNIGTTGLANTGVSIDQIDGDINTGSILNFNQTAASGITTSSNQFTTGAGYKWNEIWSGSLFGIRDQTASNYVPFSVDSGLSGTDGIFIHHNYAAIPAFVLSAGTATSPLPAGKFGLWGQTGVGVWLNAGTPVNMLGVSTRCVAVGMNTSPVAFPIGGTCTLYVHNEDDTIPTRQIVRASTTTQGTTPLQSWQDGTGATKTLINPNGSLRLNGLTTYANNAAAIAAGLSAGDIYATAADPAAIAVVF